MRQQLIGWRIKILREGKGWTPQEFAVRLGMDRANVVRLESGRHAPSLATLERVAQVLEVTVTDLFTAGAAAEPKAAEEVKS